MVIIALLATQNPEPCILIGEPRIRGNVRENGKDKLVWEFENCENKRNILTFYPKKNDKRARTEACLRRRRSIDGWMLLPTEVMYDPGKGC